MQFQHAHKRMPKVPAWAPYVSAIEVAKGKRVHVKYKGGEFTADPRNLLSLMVYGDSDAPISPQVMDLLGRAGVPIIMHRRNVPTTTWIHSGPRSQANDVLAAQMLARANEHKRRYIARTLLHEKMRAMRWLLDEQPALNPSASIPQLRVLEAHHAKQYWAIYYRLLERTDESRRTNGDAKYVLDAVSKFLSGAMLRWVSYHHLSPFHGFFHEPTGYPALVYDLIEPYRADYDRIVLDVLAAHKNEDREKLIAIAIDAVKSAMHQHVYTHETRQIVLRQELLHGVVLALRSYILGETKRFVVPRIGVRRGGRPLTLAYRLPGRDAGPSRIHREVAAVESAERARRARIDRRTSSQSRRD